MPPSLLSEKVSGWPDGRIYHVITRRTESDAELLLADPAEDRWAVIHYVRTLERAAHPLPQDLSAAGIRADSTAGAGGTGAAAEIHRRGSREAEAPRDRPKAGRPKE